MVGRKRTKAVRTADSGISSRGKAVLISSRPDRTTEVLPAATAVFISVNKNRFSVRCAK